MKSTKSTTVIKKNLELLGHLVKDKTSSYEGIVNSVSFDLYGCIQADVRPTTLTDNGEMKGGLWLDVNRLFVLSEQPLIEQPLHNVDNKTMWFLGHVVKDKISEYQGVVISLLFDLFGCVRADVRPTTLTNGGMISTGTWLEFGRLLVISKQPLMERPLFNVDDNGPAPLPPDIR